MAFFKGHQRSKCHRVCHNFNHGWFCNREPNHEGKHRFWDAGTGRGDDKLVEW